MVHLAYAGEVTAVLWLFLVAMVIDGTDGFLARRFRGKEVLPWFDGARRVPAVRVAGRSRGGRAGSRVLLPVLPDRRHDIGPPVHRRPQLLEHRRLLRHRPGAGTLATTVTLLALSALVLVPMGYGYPSRTEVACGRR